MLQPVQCCIYGLTGSLYLGPPWEPVPRVSPDVVGAELHLRQGLGEVLPGSGRRAWLDGVACRMRPRRRRARREGLPRAFAMTLGARAHLWRISGAFVGPLALLLVGREGWLPL